MRKLKYNLFFILNSYKEHRIKKEPYWFGPNTKYFYFIYCKKSITSSSSRFLACLSAHRASANLTVKPQRS